MVSEAWLASCLGVRINTTSTKPQHNLNAPRACMFVCVRSAKGARPDALLVSSTPWPRGVAVAIVFAKRGSGPPYKKNAKSITTTTVAVFFFVCCANRRSKQNGNAAALYFLVFPVHTNVATNPMGPQPFCIFCCCLCKPISQNIIWIHACCAFLFYLLRFAYS